MTRPTGLLTVENTCEAGHIADAVLVDGVKVENVGQCHTEEGWADVLECDENGRCIIVDDELQTKRIHGAIAVIWAD